MTYSIKDGYGRTLYKVRSNRKRPSWYATARVIKNKPKRTFTRRYPKISVGFPKTHMVKLRYCEQVQIDVAAGPQTYVFSANGLYDPNISGTGHQPGCFDTWATMYNHYMVMGSKISATFFPETASGDYNAIVGVKVDDDTSLSPAVNMTTLIEQPNNLFKWRMLRSNALETKNSVTIKNWYSPKKFFDIKDVKDNMDTLGALVTNNPNEACNYILVVGHGDDNADLPVIKILVNIEYIVLFSEPKDMVQS